MFGRNARTEAIEPTETLLYAVGTPWQIYVDEQVRRLEVLPLLASWAEDEDRPTLGHRESFSSLWIIRTDQDHSVRIEVSTEAPCQRCGRRLRTKRQRNALPTLQAR